MTDFIKVVAASPKVALADPEVNASLIIDVCHHLDKMDVSLAVFPEMSVTGYTCADLFHNSVLIEKSKESLLRIVSETRNLNLVTVVGMPLVVGSTMYNVAVVIGQGKIYGAVPKTYIPNYNEFYEKRWWEPAPSSDLEISVGKHKFILSTRQLFSIESVVFGIEICEDLWTPVPPSCVASLAGAEIILNLSASDALIGKQEYIEKLVLGQSARCICGYIYSSAGVGESSTDLVFSGLRLIAENGRSKTGWRHTSEINAEPDSQCDYVIGYIDIQTIRHDRMNTNSFSDCRKRVVKEEYVTVPTEGKIVVPETFSNPPLSIDPMPFVPADAHRRNERCNEIIGIQTRALAQRLEATRTKNLVLGISGGLDSTLALLIAVRTFCMLNLDLKGIHAVTMPGFGTTGRTYRNAIGLIKALGVSFREINISEAVTLHFKEIGHDAEVKDVTYENSQARQRTLLLMDIANQVNGMVVGTGDMSELALGWATYNGDHMSMYGVNAGVPKTLVKYLVENFAIQYKAIETDSKSQTDDIAEILFDIIDTPISPELIPADSQDNIVQKTEDLVGPYELHDFFLYYSLRYGLRPRSIFNRALIAFGERYDRSIILKWMKTFYRRFFSQQFKRSCMPDGPKVGSVCLSPRGDWRMPSDASSAIWIKEIEDIETEFATKGGISR